MEITIELVKNLLPKRPDDSNKGTFGKVLNIAGCQKYQGAACLSSLAPLKIGAGLVTLATTDVVVDNLASSLPWVTFFPLKDFSYKYIAANAFPDLKEIIDDYDVVSAGCGLSAESEVSFFVKDLIEYLNRTDKKVVLDADALNIISKLDFLNLGFSGLPEHSIITPHPLELSRLLDVPVDVIQSDRIKYAKAATEKYGCTTVLKGSRTVFCTKDFKIYENTSGNSSLAKAGSGDVLTGFISGLLSQGLSCEEASILGVWLHGKCGELASSDLTEYCVLSTDLIDYLPQAVKLLKGE